MKRFGLGLLAAGMLAAATLLGSLPASAGSSGGGMIWIPPMGGGMGGGWSGSPGGGWRGPGMKGGGNWGRAPGGTWRGPPTGAWHGPGGNPAGGNNFHGGQPYNGHWKHGSNNWNKRWNKNWNNHWNDNWYRNGRWYGPRYRYRYPGYNYYYGGFWYPWPWWSNVWNFEIGENYGYWGRGYASRHVIWCERRYRSYNPRTNTYTGYDGRQHRCISPYY